MATWRLRDHRGASRARRCARSWSCSRWSARARSWTPSSRSSRTRIERRWPSTRSDNARAHAAAGGGGARRHNERAFDAGRSLFEGAMLGHPYRSVIKTFQVRVWRALSAQIAALDPDARGALWTLVASTRALGS